MSAIDARTGIRGGSACDASAQCLTGACTLGVCSDWQHAMRIRIDTSAAGAGVTETVTSFPLLVRLGGDANAFDFGQARSDGGDIRFVDQLGHKLDYQIERWDRSKGRAELWVKVPRIEGSSSANTITMYWGNAFASSVASGPAVFSDYKCAYHVEDAALGTAKQILDDSGRGGNGTVAGAASANIRADGIAGYGLMLDGQSSYLASPALQPTTAVSVSLWMKAPKGAAGGLAAFTRLVATPTANHALTLNSDGTLSFSALHQSTRVPVQSLVRYDDNAWHLVTGRLSSAGQYLFVDGEAVAEDPTLTVADSSQESSWRFGMMPSGTGSGGVDSGAVPAYFGGELDEIRVRGEEESAAQIMLSYATQRPGSSVVTYWPAD